MTEQEIAELVKRLGEVASAIPEQDREWYRVESPWLSSDAETYIVSGSPDPHVATMVCDFQDASLVGVEDRFSDDEWSSRNWTIADFIQTFDPAMAQNLLGMIDSLRASLALCERRADDAESRNVFLETEIVELAAKVKRT